MGNSIRLNGIDDDVSEVEVNVAAQVEWEIREDWLKRVKGLQRWETSQ
jgi:hypothetical protein